MCDETGNSCSSPEGSADNSRTWEWKRREVQPLTPTINLNFKSKKVAQIKETLEKIGGKPLVQKFGLGQMGPLLNWRGGKSCARAVHGIVSRQIKLAEAQNHELWFRISGKNVKLSPAEFALVTGLRFGDSKFDPRVTRDPSHVAAYRQFCDGRPTTVKDLMVTFYGMYVDTSRHELYLQVASVLLLYYFVLGYPDTRKVESWVWVLVNDLDEWNRFPWGGYSYQALLHYVGLLANTVPECNPKYHFSGPVWALEVWALEAIPDLANCVAECVEDNAVPRCLRWRLGGKALEDDEKREYLANFFKEEHECRCSLMPQLHELQSDYWITANSSVPLGVHYVTPTNPLKDHTGAPILRRVVNREKRGIKEKASARNKSTSDVSDPEPPRRRTRRETTSQLHATEAMNKDKGRERTRSPSPITNTEQRILDRDKIFIDHVTDMAIEKFKTRVMPDLMNFFTDLFSSRRASPPICTEPPMMPPSRNNNEITVDPVAVLSGHDPVCEKHLTIQTQSCSGEDATNLSSEDATDAVAQTFCQFITSLNKGLGPHPYDHVENTEKALGIDENNAYVGARRRKSARPWRCLTTASINATKDTG